MKHKIRTLGIAALIVLWGALSIALWFGPRQDYSDTERRKLAQLPQLSGRQIMSGKFMEDFEDFTLDQFPLRHDFRKVKALFAYHILNQSDNNGIYLLESTVAKLEYPLNESSVRYATDRLQYVYDIYLKTTDCSIYTSVIPDKGYYLAAENGYPAMDYDKLFALYQQALPWAQYVDITDLLSPDDYYRTDTHWRQEHILKVARRLLLAMQEPVSALESYTPETVEKPFYGVYFGQAAIPMEPEALTVMKHSDLDGCRVFDHISRTYSAVYNMDKLDSPDLYDVFLSGGQPLLTVENPRGNPEKELVIFRDSFASALAPLLVSDYGKVTLVDIRYMNPDQLGGYLTFDDQDVLFLYSTLILNNGRSLK